MLTVTEEIMLTLEDVAERLNVSVMTVRRMIDRGDLDAFKVGSQLRVKESDLDAYLERQRIRPQPKNAARPARLTEGEMNKVGVDVLGRLDTGIYRLRCQNCGSVWAPNMLSGGRLPKNYWRCEKGCNSDERLETRDAN
jgi:excisionase family DNA binding protein